MTIISILNKLTQQRDNLSSEGLASQSSTTDKPLQLASSTDLLRQAPQQANIGQTAANDGQTSTALVSGFQSRAGDDPDALRAALTQAFGGKASAGQIEQLAQQILAGDTPMPANIKFVEAESLGATNYGAYDPQDGGTIYLDARLLDKPALLQDVFNEELGHHLDSVLGGDDARGDEGAIFSQALTEGVLDQKTLQQLQLEQDHGYIEVDGEQVAVEFRNEDEGSGNGQSPSPTSESEPESESESKSESESESKSEPESESESESNLRVRVYEPGAQPIAYEQPGSSVELDQHNAERIVYEQPRSSV